MKILHLQNFTRIVEQRKIVAHSTLMDIFADYRWGEFTLLNILRAVGEIDMEQIIAVCWIMKSVTCEKLWRWKKLHEFREISLKMIP